MARFIVNLAIIFSGLTLFPLLIGCGKGKDVAGGSVTETGNALVGFVQDVVGNPVANAKVCIYKTNITEDSVNKNRPDPVIIVDSMYTDGQGQFHFLGLRPGIYSIDGSMSSANLFAAKKGIFFDSTRTVTDTLVLKRAGTIRGLVYKGANIAPFSLSGFILVNIEGLYNHLTIADPYGQYTIGDIPEGVYTLGFYSNDNNYLNLFIDSIRVIPDSITNITLVTLAESPNAPPPRPTGFTAQYDTANGLVYLRWNQLKFTNLLGYKIIRKIQYNESLGDESPVLLDTSYVDTVSDLINNSKVIYLLHSIDKAYNESLNAGPIEFVIKN